MTTKQLVRNSFGWGFACWLIGYVLGFIASFFIPAQAAVWSLLPVGLIIGLWILTKKIPSGSMQQYVVLGVVWSALAILLDHIFIVALFHPANGYYAPDIYAYYAGTLLLPMIVGWWKNRT